MGIGEQQYFEKITELTVSHFDTPLFKDALLSLGSDSALQPLVPYFSSRFLPQVQNLIV
ncbi:hypothetical protein LguiA_003844 [Lonicera macranthoides]